MNRRKDMPPGMRKQHPIPDSGAWWELPGWVDILGRVGHPEVARRAMEALKATFTAEAVADMGMEHPFVHCNVLISHAFGLLELGLALSELPVSTSVKKRLLNGDQFEGAEFELWLGLLLGRLGASVEPEPLGRKQIGPDWRATWGSASIAVEAKRPARSDRSVALQRAFAEFFLEFMKDIQRPMPARALLRVSVEPGLYESMVDRSSQTVDLERARIEGGRLASDLGHRALDDPERDHYVDRHHARASLLDGTPGVQTVISGPPPNPEHELRRTRGILRKAVKQGAEANFPVVVALDAANEFGLGMRYDGVVRLLSELTEPWMNDVAAVVLRSRGSWTGHVRPHTFIDLIPGPRADEIPGEFLDGLDAMTCEHGHIHFEPLSEGDPLRCAARPRTGP